MIAMGCQNRANIDKIALSILVCYYFNIGYPDNKHNTKRCLAVNFPLIA